MKTFFSIISVTINASLNEKIGIGLILSDGNKFIYKISQPKLNIIKNLIPVNKYNVLKQHFKDLINELMPQYDSYKLINEVRAYEWLNENYFNYLNKYSNNFINYSEPKTIELDFSEESFKLIFNNYIYQYDENIEIEGRVDDIYKQIENTLYPKIDENVNFNVRISPHDFEELITPVDINFIGLNGVVVAGQTIEFDKRAYNLENDLTRFISFTKAVDYSKKTKGKYFLIGKEPNKQEHYQSYKIWKHVKESKLVDYTDINEIDKISEYMKHNHVKPFFEI